MTIITGSAYLERIRPPQAGKADHKDKRVAGLYLRVSSTGLKTWRLMVRLNGKYQPFPLGTYPKLGLAEARQKANEWKDRIRAGDDPRIEVKAEKLRDKDTFAAARDRFIVQYAQKNLKPNTVKAYVSVLNGARLREWEGKPVKSITKGDVVALIDGISAEGHDVLANRTLAYMKKFFKWCASKDLIKGDETLPTDRVEKPLNKESARSRNLDTSEIKLFWKVAGDMGYPYGPVYQLFLATGQRQTECATIKWSDIDGAQWTQKDNKPGREHIVPLSSAALAILEECPRIGPYVFTTMGDRPINGFSKSKARLGGMLAKKATQGEFAEPWVIHDLRRTMTTKLREAGISRDLCSRLLNHAEKGVTAEHYDCYDQLPEKVSAMETWGRVLNDIIHDKAANVVNLADQKRS